MSERTHIPSFPINAAGLYRMPWTPADNSLTWLELTRKCNITCDACFTANDPQSEKSLREVRSEIHAVLKLRRCDGMLLAGGEPLTHPQVVEVVKMVKAHRVKPILLTNGVGLDRFLLRDLKDAGLFGVVFHVDQHQSRPGWEGRSECELNELRQYFADMLFREKGLVCGFNITIFPDTVRFVPEVVNWIVQNVDRVHAVSFIALRLAEPDGRFDYFAGNRKIDISDTVYYSANDYKKLTSSDLYAEVRKAVPDFKLCAYLGGTVLADSIKWAVGCRIASRKKSYGYLGAKSMELLQNMHHAIKGRFLSFASPNLGKGANLMLLLGLFDRDVRKAGLNYMLTILRNPARLFERLHVQNIVVEQPIDVLASGEQDLCDGCPNKTLWKRRLISACVLEEYLKYGTSVTAVPKS